MTHKALFKVYAAGCTADGGIAEYMLYSDGSLTRTNFIPIDRPMYFIKKEDTLHVLLRAPDGFLGMSAYAQYALDGKELCAPKSTNGVVACHLCESMGDIYAANYVSGNLIKIGGATVRHAPRSDMSAGRQDAPHTHCVIPSPCKKYILCTDLGLDKIFVYDRELNFISDVSLPLGAGPRHIVFSGDGRYLYCVCELTSTVSVLSWKDGVLTHKQNISSHIKSASNLAAAIRLSPDGRFIYISQRGDDCISVFHIGDGGASLKWLKNIPCGGHGPRDIYVTPDGCFMLCANEISGDVTVLSVTDGCNMRLIGSASLPSALCIYAE